MPGQTLLDVIQQRFGVAVDPDSDGGQILNSLTPNPPLNAPFLTGTADVDPLTFAPTAHSLSVRAAKGADALAATASTPGWRGRPPISRLASPSR